MKHFFKIRFTIRSLTNCLFIFILWHGIFAMNPFYWIMFTIWFRATVRVFSKKIWNVKFLQWNILMESCPVFDFLLILFLFSIFETWNFCNEPFFLKSCSVFDFVLLFELFLRNFETWNFCSGIFWWNHVQYSISFWVFFRSDFFFFLTWNFRNEICWIHLLSSDFWERGVLRIKYSDFRSWLWIRRKRRTLSHWHSPWASADAVFWAQLHSSPCTRECESKQ